MYMKIHRKRTFNWKITSWLFALRERKRNLLSRRCFAYVSRNGSMETALDIERLRLKQVDSFNQRKIGTATAKNLSSLASRARCDSFSQSPFLDRQAQQKPTFGILSVLINIQAWNRDQNNLIGEMPCAEMLSQQHVRLIVESSENGKSFNFTMWDCKHAIGSFSEKWSCKVDGEHQNHFMHQGSFERWEIAFWSIYFCCLLSRRLSQSSERCVTIEELKKCKIHSPWYFEDWLSANRRRSIIVFQRPLIIDLREETRAKIVYHRWLSNRFIEKRAISKINIK